ncbi:F-box associated ubiquitination effector family protein [Raphanus sativus]|nr:F-box associated ubiquitination effector family protein [Raphanus sativus]
MFQVTSTPPFISPNAYSDKIGLCNLDGRLCISELKGDCKQEFWWRVEECDDKWERIFSVDLNSTSCWFGGITSQPLTPLAISRDNNKVVLSLTHQENLVDFDLDPDSTVYHLYYSGDYGLAVPYFPSLSPGYEIF